ncbi:hypothetical protein [Paenibacillus larvae]|nr:hypothetical protein [Paenibacillus larvae]
MNIKPVFSMLFFVLLFIAAGCGNEVNQEPKAETAGILIKR